MKVLAEGLQFPEGPVAFPDGSVVLVELLRGTLTRVWNGRSEVIADLGGGPNGAALGPDGAIYVTNSGGFDVSRDAGGNYIIHGPRAKADGGGGRIERIDLTTGRFERIYESAGANALSAPNDLVFDAAGGFWFTDLGVERGRVRDRSGLYYARPDGSFIDEVHHGVLSYNGVGLSPDGRTVYAADTHSGRLWAYDLSEPGTITRSADGSGPARYVGSAAGPALFDSLAVTEAGNVCVATLMPGGITTVAPDGGTSFLAMPDPYTTNICFGGNNRRTAFVTLSITGQLVALDWPEPGLKLNFSGV